MSILIFIIILAVLIFVHELGHFLAAKWSKIRVDEFALGFPPKLFKYKWKETLYLLNLIPFGGYVKIFGEEASDEPISDEDKKRNFSHKPKLIQIGVLVAGVLFNLLFAWLLITISITSGMPVPVNYAQGTDITSRKIIVTNILKNSPAFNVGINKGDSIISLSKDNKTVTANNIDTVQNFILNSKGESFIINYEENGKSLSKELKAVNGLVSENLAIGISMQETGILKLPIYKAVVRGFVMTIEMVRDTAQGLLKFIFSAFMGKASMAQISGPVGIIDLVSSASQLGFIYLLSFTAFISINLAVLNIIPFPALDGGRILFVIIEAVKRSPIKPKVANTFNAVGFMLLIALMLFVTYKDIVKLIIQ